MALAIVSEPLVSIVTPCRNGESHLLPYIQGVIAQTYQNIELVFVDDGSNDGTNRVFAAAEAQLRERFAGRVLYIRRPNSSGPCAAMNVGYSAAQGDWLAPCDSDDVMLPNRIADHVRCLSDNPGCRLVYGDYFICPSLDEIPPTPVLGSHGWFPSGRAVYGELLSEGMFIKCGGYCFHRSCLELLPEGKLNEDDPGQNLELLLRVSHRYGAVPHRSPVVCIVERQGSLTRGDKQAQLVHAIRSRKIIDRVLADLGCEPNVARMMNQRCLPSELTYYCSAGMSKETRQIAIQALKYGLLSKKVFAAFVASLTPWTRRWYARRCS